MSVLLRLEEVTKRFGGLTAVDCLSFEVEAGEIVGVIGPNGAGKTTAINVISGTYPPTSGRVYFDGRDITALKPHQIAKAGIGRTFQSLVLFMDLPVLENVLTSLHLSYRTWPGKRLFAVRSVRAEEDALRAKAAEILDLLGLTAVAHEAASSLPYGQQRILGVGLALATSPRLLLLDEPFTGMNENEISEMVTLVQRLRDDGIAIAMVEHNMGAVMRLCDRLVVLDHGEKIAEGVPSVILEDPVVTEAYLGKDADPVDTVDTVDPVTSEG